MKLSSKGRYAVMAMADLAMHDSVRPISLTEISIRQDISLSYLEQLFARLRKHSLVRSIRGSGGGYLLARSSENIRISDIVISVDEPLTATRCKPGSATGCHRDRSRCLTHDLWEELGNQIQMYLSSVTLADVINSRVLGSSSLFLERQLKSEVSSQFGVIE